jgi:hypothetical protein
MDLAPYVNDLQRHLSVAAEAGGDEARASAERLGAALEAATRLVLLEALSAAAGEITRELAPGSVDLRLRHGDPEFVVSVANAVEYSDVAAPSATPAAASIRPDSDLDDVSTSRTTLRLPDQLKSRVDAAAAEAGISVNAWFVKAIADALEPKNRKSAQKDSRSSDHYTGWAR